MYIYNSTQPTFRRRALSALTAAASLLTIHARAQTFVPTSRVNASNNDANWSSAPFPTGAGTTATISAPTAALTVDLGQPIVVGTLNINKAAGGDFDTTILGSTTNTL